MQATARWLVSMAVVVTSSPVRAGSDLVYVAMGERSSGGVARAGEPVRIAQRLERSGKRVRLIDLTTPRATSQAVRVEQLMRAVSLRPALVTLTLGESDVCGRTTLWDFSWDLQVITDLLHRNSPHVIIATIPVRNRECGRPSVGLSERVDEFNWAIVRAAKRNGLWLAERRVPREGAISSWEVAVGEEVARAFAPAEDAGTGAATGAGHGARRAPTTG